MSAVLRSVATRHLAFIISSSITRRPGRWTARVVMYLKTHFRSIPGGFIFNLTCFHPAPCPAAASALRAWHAGLMVFRSAAGAISRFLRAAAEPSVPTTACISGVCAPILDSYATRSSSATVAFANSVRQTPSPSMPRSDAHVATRVLRASPFTACRRSPADGHCGMRTTSCPSPRVVGNATWTTCGRFASPVIARPPRHCVGAFAAPELRRDNPLCYVAIYMLVRQRPVRPSPSSPGSTSMPALRDFIPRLGSQTESICSNCCQVVRPSPKAPTLQQAQSTHRCRAFSLNTTTR